MSWWNGPLAGLDFETTDADPETARVVTACVAYRSPGIPAEPQDTASWLVNPGVPISAEATAVHGISDETASRDGQDPARAMEAIRQAVKAVILSAPLVIFNAPFDLTILDRECRRHGLPPVDLRDALVIDPLCLDKHTDRWRKGKRTLTAQCEHHSVRLDGAHDATADTLAAMRLAWRLGQKYRGIGDMDPRALMHLQRAAYRRQATSLEAYFTRIGEPKRCSTDWPLIPYPEDATVRQDALTDAVTP